MANSLNDHMKTADGLRDLCMTYGDKKGMTVEEAVLEFPTRVFWMGGMMIVAYDDDMLQTMHEMMYGW